MNLPDVYAEIEQRLRTIPKLNVPPVEELSITPPAALLSLPDSVTYSQSYSGGFGGGGMITHTIEFIVVLSQSNRRAAAKAAMEYASPEGPKSVISAVDSRADNRYTTCDEVTVEKCEFDTVRYGEIDYLGCVFTASIVGSGG